MGKLLLAFIGLAAVLVISFAGIATWMEGNSQRQYDDELVARDFDHDKAGGLSRPRKDYLCKDCNVVVIVIDALRADHLGHFGYGRNTSPEMDAIAESSLEFMNAYSQESYTTPSVATLFTSAYPTGHGVLNYGEFSSLSDDYTTLAEAMSAGGYQTAAFIYNPNLAGGYNLGQGFDIYDYGDEGFEGEDRVWEMESAQKIEGSVRAWLRGKKEGKYMLYLHYRDVHSPYLPPPPYDTAFGTGGLTLTLRDYQRKQIRDYDGEIAYTDHMIGRLIREIGDEKTLFVITSDHGEEFLEHGGEFHLHTLYEEVLKVPLIFHYPGRDIGDRVYAPAELRDVAPTILSIVGIERPETFEGEDLLAGRGGQPIRSGGRHGRAVIIRDGIKYYRYKSLSKKDEKAAGYDLSARDFKEDVFDLSVDPYEIQGGPGHLMEWDSELSAEAEAYASSTPGYSPGTWEMDERIKDRLKQLGYLK